MRSRASWRNETTSRERARPNPFRTTFHWNLAPGGARLELDADHGAPAVAVPVLPLLLTGGAGTGGRATLDAIARHAAGERWAIARLDARSGCPMRPRVADAFDRAVETIVHAHTDDAAIARMRAIVGSFRTSVEADELAYAPVLGALASVVGEAGWGILLVVHDLHAARRGESEALLAAAAAVMAYNAGFRAIVSATHRSSVATEGATRDAWTELPLLLTAATLADVLDRAAARDDRRFTPDAIDALLRASGGVAELALAHAATAWDSTQAAAITADRVAVAGERAEAAFTSALRAAYSTQLSLGQRRYLRAVLAHGESGADLDQVAQELTDVTRFGLSEAMLDTVLVALVQHGLLFVHDGRARVAVPGLSRIL